MGTVYHWPQNPYIEEFRDEEWTLAEEGSTFFFFFNKLRMYACLWEAFVRRLMEMNVEGKWLLPPNQLLHAAMGSLL